MGTDLSVVNAARVSFGKESELNELGLLSGRDAKLIKYLADHDHISPFHHTFITMHVKAPIFVARQLVKHKFMPWNEISRRYVDDEPEFYIPDVWRGRSKDKKQGSEGVVDLWDYNMYENFGVIGSWSLAEEASEHWSRNVDCYNKMLDAGVAPEQARMVLPQSMYTEWYWSGTLSAWADMYNLRTGDDVQQETAEIAEMAGDIIEPLFPISWRALTS
jgi:thymidylate synthase (FAD)